MTSVEVEGLCFAYHKKSIFENAGLYANQGDVVAVLGANGSGKTTLLKLIGGLLFPKKGAIALKGFQKGESQHCVGLLESPKLWSHMTGDENLRCFLGDDYNENKAKEAFARWGMEDAISRPVRKYSMGMRQKLGLIMSFASERSVLLLDEPLNSLDMESANVFYNELNETSKNGRITFLVSHIMEDLQRNCTKMYEIQDRSLVLREDPLPTYISVIGQFADVSAARKAAEKLMSAKYLPEVDGCSVKVKGIRPGRFLFLVTDEGLLSLEKEESPEVLQGGRE